jgi:methionyl-tRNA formyltransferase
VVHEYALDAQREDVTIDWETMDSDSVMALVNAANPWNRGAFTSIRGLQMSILEVSPMPSSPSETSSNIKPGVIIALDDQVGLLVKSCDGKILRIEILHTEMGFITGKRLAALGVRCGEQLGK